MDEEKNIDIKGTFEKFIKADEPEMTQEEAIKNYKEESISKAIRKRKNSSEDEGGEGNYTEEQEHLKRIKEELLASLERVKQLEKQIYGEQNKEKEKLKIKDTSSATGGKYIQKEENKKDFETMTKEPEQKERE